MSAATIIPRVERLDDCPVGEWRPHLPVLEIGQALWTSAAVLPRAGFQWAWDGAALEIRFRVEAPPIPARFRNFQDPVYRDACVEWFIQPRPGFGQPYLNIEGNALGTLLVAWGPDRQRRQALDSGLAQAIEVHSLPIVDGQLHWGVVWRVGREVLETLAQVTLESGYLLAGNVMVCADDALPRYYGAWRPIPVSRPDFHRPEFFAALRLQ